MNRMTVHNRKFECISPMTSARESIVRPINPVLIRKSPSLLRKEADVVCTYLPVALVSGNDTSPARRVASGLRDRLLLRFRFQMMLRRSTSVSWSFPSCDCFACTQWSQDQHRHTFLRWRRCLRSRFRLPKPTWWPGTNRRITFGYDSNTHTNEEASKLHPNVRVRSSCETTRGPSTAYDWDWVQSSTTRFINRLIY